MLPSSLLVTSALVCMQPKTSLCIALFRDAGDQVQTQVFRFTAFTFGTLLSALPLHLTSEPEVQQPS